MSLKEQRKIIEILSKYEKKFDKLERTDFVMLLKRHRDDEDLDKLSMERLRALYEKYYLSRAKTNLDGLFKKSENESPSE